MPNSIPALIIPVLNRFDLLERVLDSIDFPIDNILIIDNSNSYSLAEKYNHLNIHLLKMPSNFGVAASWNLGIKSYPHLDYWLIGSCDNIFKPGTLEAISKNSSKDKLLKTIGGFGMFSLGSNVVKTIGLFDENFYPAYYEDVDYESRVAKSGIDAISYLDTDIEIFGSATTVQSNPIFMEKNNITNESNYEYWNLKNSEGYAPKEWSLERRINNDWMV
jgi:GT2 family glycosyltransferase